VHWSRAARTDKGVSAVGNVVSLKMLIGAPDLLQRINAALPPQARAPRRQPGFRLEPARMRPALHPPASSAHACLQWGARRGQD
jgi:hypothetical protein